MRSHGVPKNIISNRDAKFAYNLWKTLFASFRKNLAFNTSYHPQTDRLTERIKSVVEDMQRMYVMHHPKRWEEFLPLVEFSYNNGYQESLKMNPFNALYEKKCNTPIS